MKSESAPEANLLQARCIRCGSAQTKCGTIINYEGQPDARFQPETAAGWDRFLMRGDKLPTAGWSICAECGLIWNEMRKP
jgi:hypothetical protein